jgi:hypothetical protein
MTELETTPAWPEIASLVATTPLAAIAARFAHVPGLTPGAIAAAWTRVHPLGAAFDLDEELPPEPGDARLGSGFTPTPSEGARSGAAWRVVWRGPDGASRSGVAVVATLGQLVTWAESVGEVHLLERLDGRVIEVT